MKPETEEETPRPISTASPVQLGLVIAVVALLVGCVGGFGYWNWWASAISTKLDIVIANQTAQVAVNANTTADIVNLQKWREKVEASGTPAMKQRVDVLENRVDILQGEWNVHKATSTKYPP